jgi:hypothetical protein
MVNDALQWTVLAVLTFLVLGVLREISIHLPVAKRALANGGPELGERVPRRLLREVSRLQAADPSSDGLLLAFISQGCVGCQALLAALHESRAIRDGQQLLLVAKTPSEQFRMALVETGFPLFSADDNLWEECHITNTPLVVKVESDGRVEAKGVTHRVDTVALTA